jgi:hypothetical protein
VPFLYSLSNYIYFHFFYRLPAAAFIAISPAAPRGSTDKARVAAPPDSLSAAPRIVFMVRAPPPTILRALRTVFLTRRPNFFMPRPAMIDYVYQLGSFFYASILTVFCVFFFCLVLVQHFHFRYVHQLF